MADPADHRHTTPATMKPTLVRPQHVLICVTGVWGDTSSPGLLLEWRHVAQGDRWEGLVVWVTTYSGGWDLRQNWLRAEHIRRRD